MSTSFKLLLVILLLFGCVDLALGWPLAQGLVDWIESNRVDAQPAAAQCQLLGIAEVVMVLGRMWRMSAFLQLGAVLLVVGSALAFTGWVFLVVRAWQRQWYLGLALTIFPPGVALLPETKEGNERQAVFGLLVGLCAVVAGLPLIMCHAPQI